MLLSTLLLNQALNEACRPEKHRGISSVLVALSLRTASHVEQCARKELRLVRGLRLPMAHLSSCACSPVGLGVGGVEDSLLLPFATVIVSALHRMPA